MKGAVTLDPTARGTLHPAIRLCVFLSSCSAVSPRWLAASCRLSPPHSLRFDHIADPELTTCRMKPSPRVSQQLRRSTAWP